LRFARRGSRSLRGPRKVKYVAVVGFIVNFSSYTFPM
jgi:hypothetical protein